MDDASLSDGGWISWFCSLEGHEFFAEIPEEYIRDAFNLYGLRRQVAHYSEALQMILSEETPDEEDLQNETFLEVYQEATDLYGLIHARFIQSTRGLAVMREKFLAGEFGTCPRVFCERQPVMPVGMSDEIRTSRVKVYCPRCKDVFIPNSKQANVDGCYFGTSFPHILNATYHDIKPLDVKNQYEAKIYGFRVYKGKGSKFNA